MGNRKFYDQMLLDACHHHQMKVTDEVDVTTMKEYMQVRYTVSDTILTAPNVSVSFPPNSNTSPPKLLLFSIVTLISLMTLFG